MEVPIWWTVAGSVIPSLAVGCWTFIQWWASRHDKRQDRSATAEEKREAIAQREREQMASNAAALFNNLRAELDRCQSRLEQVDDDRYRAWGRARWWYQMCWDLMHIAAGARQVADAIARLTGQPLPVWPRDLPTLPAFDDDVKAPPPRQP